MVQERGTTIDWLNHYMTLPLAKPLEVTAGDVVDVAFQYRAGASIPSLQAALRATLAVDASVPAPPLTVRTVEFA
jgi:hypothetical protein